MGAAALPLLFIGATALSVAGQISAGRQQENIGRQVAQQQAEIGQQEQAIAESNAKILEEDAKAAKEKAKYDEAMHRDRVRQFLSKQRAAIGRSGVSVAGSPLLALLDTTQKGEMDALAIRKQGQTESKRLLNQASITRKQGKVALYDRQSQGQIALAKGKAARNESYFNAGSSLLSGGYQYYKLFGK